MNLSGHLLPSVLSRPLDKPDAALKIDVGASGPGHKERKAPATAVASPPASFQVDLTASGRVQLRLLNGFELARGVIRVPIQPAAQRLVAFVALQAGPVSRYRLAGLLWPNSTGERAVASLRSTIWRLNRLAKILETFGHQLRLRSDVDVDVRQLSDLSQQFLAGRSKPNWDDLTRLLARDELLPDWDDDWVLVERERFEQRRLHALEVASSQLIQIGRFGDAIDAALAAVAIEPLRESSNRVLIEAYLAEGNQAEAVRQFRRYRRLLQTELALAPSERIREVVRGLVS